MVKPATHHHQWTKLGAIVLLLGLGGCMSWFRGEIIPNWDLWNQRQQQLQDVGRWQLSAKVATGSVVGIPGTLIWRQRNERFDVRLAGPLGAGGMRLSGTPDAVLVRTKEQKFTTKKPGALMQREFGWQFPLQGMRYWAMGLPQPGIPATTQVDDKGLAMTLSQHGWQVEYDDYQDINGTLLPESFSIANDDITIRVNIHRWIVAQLIPAA